MRATLASAADARYGHYLLNLLGSVKANSDLFDQVVAYDLGLTPLQRRLLDSVRGVEVRTVPPFIPHWRQGRTWKTWIWTHIESEIVVWLDAGITVLRSLAEPLDQIRRRGYFVVSQAHPIDDSTPRDFIPRYALTEEQLQGPAVAAGIIGFRRDADFYTRVIVPTYEDALEGLNLGFSAAEKEKLNIGMDRLDDPPVRDCRIFRHEQTLLGIHFYQQVEEPSVNDVYKYGGWKSPNEHPEQLIWSHRRRGDLRYLPRIPYVPRLWLFGKAWGIWAYCSWWKRNHSWLFRPTVYLRKLRLVR